MNTMDKRMYQMIGLSLLAGSLVMMNPQPAQAVQIDFDHQAAAESTAAKENPAQEQWYWLASDDNYSKYFDPESVVITRTVETARGKVPTEVQVWTKTSYSYGGAKETLAAYGLSEKFPDPAQLSFSTAQLVIKPQYRTVQCVAEHFYNPAGDVIWSEANPAAQEREINSQQFNEAYYAAAIDQAFHQNKEMERVKAKNRWLTVFDSTSPEGIYTHTKADTSTMRMQGSNLVFWQWQEVKDPNGQVMEIKFLKVAVNLPQATEKAIAGKCWTPQEGWKSLDAAIDGQYRMVSRASEEYRYIIELRNYVENHSAWVHRYGLE